MKKTQVSIIKCQDYNPTNILTAVRRSIDLIGGVSDSIAPGQRVLIKPNILSARRPEEGVTTHPEVIRAIITILKEVQAEILVGDSPSCFSDKDIDEIYKASGIERLCKEEDVKLIRFSQVVQIDGIPIAKALKEVDYIISAPKMKTHNLTVLTGGVKNMFGAVVGGHKLSLHLKFSDPVSFSSQLVDIFSHVKPQLTIMDAVVGMEGDGPAGGKLKSIGLILSSKDAIALDSVFAQLVDISPFSVPTIKIGHERKLGVATPEDIEVLGEEIVGVKMPGFSLPKPSVMLQLSGSLLWLFGKAMKLYPKVNKQKCTRCQTCAKACPVNAITITDSSCKINYSKCICCYCCHELCPSNAIEFKQSLLKKLLNFALSIKRKIRSMKKCPSQQ